MGKHKVVFDQVVKRLEKLGGSCSFSLVWMGKIHRSWTCSGSGKEIRAAGSDFGRTCRSKLNGGVGGFSQNPAFLRADGARQLWLGSLGW